MRDKKTIKYIISAAIMITLLICVGIVYDNFNKDKNMNFSVYLYYTTFAVFSFVIGCLLGIDEFLRKVRTTGKWKLDIPRLLILGIPSLIISIFFYLYYLDISWLYKITNFLIKYLQSIYVQTFSQVIFGYVFITSFYKSSEDQFN